MINRRQYSKTLSNAAANVLSPKRMQSFKLPDVPMSPVGTPYTSKMKKKTKIDSRSSLQSNWNMSNLQSHAKFQYKIETAGLTGDLNGSQILNV